MIIKFDPSSFPEWVTQDFLIDDLKTGQREIGYRVFIGGDIRVKAGDFIYFDKNGPTQVVTIEEYEGDKLLKVEIDRAFGQQLINEILADHKPVSLEDDIAFVSAIDAVDKSLRYGKLELTKDVLSKLIDTKTISEEVKADIVSKIDGFVVNAK